MGYYASTLFKSQMPVLVLPLLCTSKRPLNFVYNAERHHAIPLFAVYEFHF